MSSLCALTIYNMPVVNMGWSLFDAFFKGEGSQINIGLGQGSALEIFNSNIGSLG